MSGAVAAMMLGGASFTPLTHLYTSGSGTETIPAGATTLVVESWGGGAGGNKGIGIGCAQNYGAAGSGGGYSRTLISVSGYGNYTMSYSVGAAGVGGPGQTAGGASSVSSGTFSITTLSDGGGATAAGAGGSASGGNQNNTTGNVGAAATTTGNGAAGITGNSGAVYGAGGNAGFGSSGTGSAGQSGAVKFSYV